MLIILLEQRGKWFNDMKLFMSVSFSIHGKKLKIVRVSLFIGRVWILYSKY